jgi:monooxygenase
MENEMTENFDVLIIGAGVAGIGAACHLAMDCPGKRVGIVERRNAIGGTWDLFRYPGIRSDSDMFSFGFDFRPWNELKVLPDGPSIRSYVTETAREYGVDKQIRFGLKTISADWDGGQRCWTVTALHEARGETHIFRTDFLIGATGYYNYDQGFRPDFPGVKHFRGPCVHPQHWPEQLDYRGKSVVVIGSGATAVTLLPNMAGEVAHVTMLQRSPTYILSLPAYDKISGVLRKVLPEKWVFAMARKFAIRRVRWIYLAARRWPAQVRKLLLLGVKKGLGNNADMSHFTPHYKPWDERLCAVPDDDIFKAIRSGKASVVTDEIETFTETGILLKSGTVLDADIIVTATGLQIQMLGGMELRVDQKTRNINSLMTYKGVLLQDVPNMALIFGYTNAAWTMKVDIASRYICRLLNHMDAKGLAVATPRAPEGCIEDDTILGSLGSGYIQRAKNVLPRQGRDLPWRVLHHYERDSEMLLKQPIEDGVLEFLPMRASAAKDAAALAA